ncbi:CAP domain-containing protein [Flammeovirgaceae bacterium SG7u.111]|nr:CAP domain-containing protein [Flammeovirgaceae bacterium SG7u.132]WPO34293.1 CAP domain-containing protein [Flammeovirgaceae bacterium SG7u.111]
MKLALSILFTFVGLSFPSQAQDSPWHDGLYSQYDFNSFVELAIAQREMDFKNIDYPLLNAAVFYETNRMRKKKRLPVFQHSAKLEEAAFGHSTDMVERNFYGHNSKVRGKKTVKDRLALVGLTNLGLAENVAQTFALQMSEKNSYYLPSQNGGYFSLSYRGEPVPAHTYLSFAKSLVKEWMDSPGHRANILDKSFTHLGCGIRYNTPKKQDDFPMFMATQNFGTRGE